MFSSNSTNWNGVEMRKFNLILSLLLLAPSFSYAAAPSRVYNYVAHNTIDPVENNANENALYTYLQAGVDTYASGSITNDAISAIAAISYSKLNLINSITNADISSSAAIGYSKLNLTGGIVNADISGSAAIVASKLDLTSPGAIGSTAANTGAFSTLKVGTTNQGDILYDNGTSFVRLTPGTNNQFLKTQGAGENPAWADVPQPVGYNLISTTSMSSVSTSSNVSIDSTKQYLVKVLITGSSVSAITQLRFNGDSGSNYSYVNRGFDTGATASNSNGSGASAINLGVASAPDGNINQYIDIVIYPQGTSSSKNLSITGISAGDALYNDFFAMWRGTATATYFNLLRSSGTMSGTIYLYELATS